MIIVHPFRNTTISASCSIRPDSLGQTASGDDPLRCSETQESCDNGITHTSSSFARILIATVIALISLVLSPYPRDMSCKVVNGYEVKPTLLLESSALVLPSRIESCAIVDIEIPRSRISLSCVDAEPFVFDCSILDVLHIDSYMTPASILCPSCSLNISVLNEHRMTCHRRIFLLYVSANAVFPIPGVWPPENRSVFLRPPKLSISLNQL